MLLNLLLLIFISSPSFAAESKEGDIFFKSFKDSTTKVNLKNNKYKAALMIDEDCHMCAKLIKKLNAKCSSFDKTKMVVFATGKKKGLGKKLKTVLKKDFNVYHHPEIESLLSVGLTALPSYISSKGKLFVGFTNAFKAMLKDKTCIK